MPLTSPVPYFGLDEFKHPELVNARAAMLLSKVRARFGEPIQLTDDARLPGDAPPGASTSSLHYLGQAFDLRIKFWSREKLWKFVAAVMSVAADTGESIELELVWSKTDRHAHLGFFLDGRPSRLIIAAD